MRSLSLSCGVAVVILAISSQLVLAGPVSLQPAALTDILGPSPTAIGSILSSNMDAGNLRVDTISQAYTNGSGTYVYLYQIFNTGTPANSSVETFTLWPFDGANDSTQVGYLTGAMPTGFTVGGQDAGSRAYVKGLTSGTQISIYYNLLDDLSIAPGDHSKVLYVISNQSPTQIVGNVIDGAVGTGPVVGPVPEPATLCLLGLGALVAIRRRKA